MMTIREDHEAGLVRASICRLDGSGVMEIATINARMARDVPGVFDKWHRMLTEAFTHIMDDIDCLAHAAGRSTAQRGQADASR